MNFSTTFSKAAIPALLVAALLSACGGNGSNTAASGAATTARTGPSPSAAPTKALANTPAERDALKSEMLAAYAASKDAAKGASFDTSPSAIRSTPYAVASTLNCADYAAAGQTGSGTISMNYPDAIATGTTYSFTYNNCKFDSTYTYNGSFNYVYTRYVSADNWAYNSTYSNFTVTGGGVNYSYAGTQTYDYNAPNFTWYYSDAAGTRGWSGSGTTALTYDTNTNVVNGSYSTTYDGGTITATFTNFGPTSGSYVVTGSDGTKITFTRTSATAYTVVTLINGVSTTTSYS